MVISDEVCALVQADPEAFGLDAFYEPRLGCATTGQLLQELSARFMVSGNGGAVAALDGIYAWLDIAALDYRTIDI